MKKQIILPDYTSLYIGKTATGKTTEIKKHIKQYVSIRKKHKLPYRVLIIDPIGEYKDFASEISVDKISTFKNKICFIKKRSLNSPDLVNMLLVIENPNYNVDPLFLRGLTSTCRTHKRSLILSYNNFSSLDPRTANNSDYLTLFNTLNSLKENEHIYNLGINEYIDVLKTCINEQSRLDRIKVMIKYSRFKTIEKKCNTINMFQKATFDLINKKVIGVSEEAFFDAVMNLSTQNNVGFNTNKTVNQLIQTANLITHYSKYYGN